MGYTTDQLKVSVDHVEFLKKVISDESNQKPTIFRPFRPYFGRAGTIFRPSRPFYGVESMSISPPYP